MPDIADVAWSEHDERNSEAVPNGWPTGAFPAYTDLVGQMMMGATKRFWNKINPVYQTTGTGDDYVVQTEIGIDQINLYEILCIRIDRTNTTTTPTLQFGATNARTIVKAGPSGYVPLAAGDMYAGNSHTFWYNGAFYVLTDPAIVVGGTVQPYSPNLTSWAAINRPSWFDSLAAGGVLPIANGGTNATAANAARQNLSVLVYVSDRTSLGNLDPTVDTVAAFDGSIWYAVAYSGVSTLVTADVAQGMYLRSVTNNAFAWVRQSDTIEIEFFNVQPYPADATVGLASAFAVFNILGRTITARAIYKSTAQIVLTNTFLDLRGVGERDAGIVFTASNGIKVDNSTISDVIQPVSIEKFGIWTTTVGLYTGLEVDGGGAAYANQVMCHRLDTNSFLYSGYWAKHVYLNNAGQSSMDECNIACPSSRALPSYGISTNGGNLVTVSGGVYLYLQYAFDVNGTGSFMVEPGTFILACDYVGRRQGTETHLYWSGCHAAPNLGCWVVTTGNHFFFTNNFVIPNTGNFIGFDISSTFGVISNNQIVNANLLAGTSIGVKVRSGASAAYISENIWYGLTNGVVVDTGASNIKVFDNEVTGGMSAASGLSDSGTGTQFRAASSSGFSFNEALLPWADDGAALGSTTTKWSDLFLASGAVINYANGDYTITHASGTLSFSGNVVATGVVNAHNVGVSGATVPSNGMYLPAANTLGFAASTAKIQLTTGGFSPQTNGTVSLGQNTSGWSAAYFSSGGTLNFGPTNYTVTHSAGNLSFNGSADFTGAVLPTVSGTPSLGSATKMWANLFLASGGIVNFNNGNYTVTHTSGVLTFSGAILSSGTGGVGYATGAGGAVTQATSRTTGVTLNKTSGGITLFSAAGTTTPATFTVTNSAVAATDTIILNQKTGANQYVLLVTAVAAGSFNITLYALAGAATEAPVINFNVIKGVTA